MPSRRDNEEENEAPSAGKGCPECIRQIWDSGPRNEEPEDEQEQDGDVIDELFNNENVGDEDDEEGENLFGDNMEE